MKLKKARKLRDFLLIIGIVIMLLSFYNEAFMTIGIILTISCLIPHFLFNKCPHCKKQLGRNDGPFCQHCGKRIDS